jgi:putative membrane protein insertion efficiency factor
MSSPDHRLEVLGQRRLEIISDLVSRRSPVKPNMGMMKKLALLLIKVYQVVISPLTGPACRFIPTCSEYAYQAISSYGFFRGGLLALKRVLRCHPFNPGGFDPVP